MKLDLGRNVEKLGESRALEENIQRWAKGEWVCSGLVWSGLVWSGTDEQGERLGKDDWQLPGRVFQPKELEEYSLFSGDMGGVPVEFGVPDGNPDE